MGLFDFFRSRPIPLEEDPEAAAQAATAAAAEEVSGEEDWEAYLKAQELGRREKEGAEAEEEKKKREEAEREAEREAREKEREAEEKREREERRLESTLEPRREIKERERSLLELRYEVGKAEAEKKLRAARGSRFERVMKGVGKAGMPLRAGAKGLGGLTMVGKRGRSFIEETYIPKARAETYIPTSMRALTAPRGQALREVSAPEYTPLRRMASPTAMGGTELARQAVPSRALASPLAYRGDVSSSEALERLRQISAPKGLSPIEMAAYSEIRRNGDVDTKSHVVEELIQLGVPKSSANGAVDTLVSKGMVRESREFEGEPVLEVVR